MPKLRQDAPAPLATALSYTLQQAARLCGLSTITLRRRGAEGKLRLFRCGGRCMVDGDSLRQMVGASSSHPNQHAGATP
jgi:hypothetical protein